jgi:hypothetical protein
MFDRTTRFYILLAFLGLLLLTLFPVIGEAQTSQPRPYVARYDLALGDNPGTGGITALKGSYQIHAELRCDGWLINEAMEFQMQGAQGPLPPTAARSRSWESIDGRGYRYELTVTRGNQVVEQVDLKALMGGAGQPGRAEFTLPQQRSVDLPAGTMFPNDFKLYLIEQAMIGQNAAGRTVFPGWGSGKPFAYSARMGRPENTPSGQTNGLDAMGNAIYWPMQMAVNDPSTGQELMKQAMTLRADGIAGSYVFDYTTFTMAARLMQVQPLQMPTCN